MPWFLNTTQKALFWSKVGVTDIRNCWLWSGYHDPHGYGVFKFMGKPHRAHRVMWFLITEKEAINFVCHHCDTPSCVNPTHLFEGTVQDNVDDMRAKGRGRYLRGELHSQARLSDSTVAEIRQATGKHKEIAEVFHIHQSTVSRIKSNKRRQPDGVVSIT